MNKKYYKQEHYFNCTLSSDIQIFCVWFLFFSLRLKNIYICMNIFEIQSIKIIFVYFKCKIDFSFHISFSFLNSCVNPVALYCVSGVFRQHFHRYLCCRNVTPSSRIGLSAAGTCNTTFTSTIRRQHGNGNSTDSPMHTIINTNFSSEKRWCHSNVQGSSYL